MRHPSSRVRFAAVDRDVPVRPIMNNQHNVCEHTVYGPALGAHPLGIPPELMSELFYLAQR